MPDVTTVLGEAAVVVDPKEKTKTSRSCAALSPGRSSTPRVQRVGRRDPVRRSPLDVDGDAQVTDEMARRLTQE